MNIAEMKERIFSEIEKNKAEMVKLNDDLFDNPEISGEEYESSKKIVTLLNSKGYATEYPFAGIDTAFKAVYGENNHKYKVAILTEYDALPEIGHACGHCLSAAISVLAGISTRELQNELDTDIHIIGTPIEETDGAKCEMVKKGVFDGYDMAIMVHLYNYNLVRPKLQALDSYMYNFHGKSSHASSAPWDGDNAFNACQLMFHATDMLRQHVTPDVRIHGIIRNGGEAPNIVPEFVSAEVYVRALDRAYLNDVVRKVDDCARGGAIATQTTWDKFATAAPYDDMKANATGEAVLTETFAELGLPLNGDTEKIFGSSDAGNVSYVCPTFHPCVQVVNEDVAIHTRGFADGMKTERAYTGLENGAKIIALQIAKIFSDEEKIAAMKADFEAKK
ncbi:MAG: M20 family metallopeptidase [Eubacteriaceae bacterium]|nr:M20 family metallopeptidase [Eubacteriaceae bacterium]